MAGVSGRSGRPPKPTKKKLLAGNPGKRKLNNDEPEFSLITSVQPAEWLDEVSATMWVMLSKELCANQILCVTDLHNLEAFCVAYSNFVTAQKELKQKGLIVMGATGGPVKNPAATILNEAMKQMATFGSLLGLDPSSRQRLVGPKGSQQNNPFHDL